jgi:hypothetical protein
MIHFTCKQCGKTHSRPDTAAGTMVFCTCGNGNTVPWESTAAEPADAPPVATGPSVPELAPIQFEPVTIAAPPSSTPPPTYDCNRPNDPQPAIDEDRASRRGRGDKRDPEFCFNHQRRPRVDACAECEEAFCPDCLVRFQGVMLCGPCKNFRSRRQELPPVASSVANASLIISLLAGPLMMCFFLTSPGNSAMRILSLVSLVPQFLALGLGVWALYDAEKEHKGGGQGVALTGVAASSLICVVVVFLNLAASRLAPG